MSTTWQEDLAEADRLEARAAGLLEEARVLRERAAARRREEEARSRSGLRADQHSAKVVRAMPPLTAETRARKNAAISAARAQPGDPVMAAARESGITSQRKLAEILDISPGSLIDYKLGRRPIPPDVDARAVESLGRSLTSILRR